MPAIDISHVPEESGARLLRFVSCQGTKPDLPVEFVNAKWDDFEAEKVAIFIHGFTANASYLGALMQEFADNKFVALAFNYPSYDGIDCAADELEELLAGFDSASGNLLSKKRKVSLVCHSMGGLVARAFVSLNGGNRFVDKVITLGTPHDATLINSQIVKGLITCGEYWTGLTSGGYSSSSRSALQLTMKDGEVPFLKTLLDAAPVSPDVAYYSMSGGKNKLKFGKNIFHNKIVNAFLQWQLAGVPNDGLVPEDSSNFSDPKFRTCSPTCIGHVGATAYTRYSKTNHSYLISTQALTAKAMAFAE